MKDNYYNRLWDMHVIEHLEDGTDLIAVDRIFLHDLCGTYSFQRMDESGYSVWDSGRVFATPDHTLSTAQNRLELDTELVRRYQRPLAEGCRKRGITLFDVDTPHQGIAHIVGPETGLSLPGTLLVCGDSHTCTHGAMGALAYGIGTNEVVHALATSCLLARRAKTLEICLHGRCSPQVDAMDVILSVIAREGVEAAVGCAVVFTGDGLQSLGMEERFTLCNLCIEMGADTALVPVDEVTLSYLEGRLYAPKGAQWEAFCRHCQQIMPKSGDCYDRRLDVSLETVVRQVSWGIHPGHTVAVTGQVPAIGADTDRKTAEGFQKAYGYMALEPGTPLAGIPIQQVFIGSCSNGRISTLEKAAEVVRGRHVHPGVSAWVVPGSVAVEREACRRGLDKVFTDAGFHWGRPCCGLCVGSNGETVPSGHRCVSTTNRNFIGRQGVGARTHLASALTAAMAAVTGVIG